MQTKEEKRAYNKDWHAVNKDKIHKRQKAYRLSNRDKLLAKGAEYRAKNKEKIRAKNAKYRSDNLEKIKEYAKSYKDRAAANNRKHKYGLTKEEYDSLCARQQGKCASCGDSAKLVVDHNHKTGNVRELLCSPCNIALGHLHEDLERCEYLVKYIKKHL